MAEQFKLLLASVSFLSIIPTGMNRRLTGETLGRSAPYFPVVGLVIGTFAMFLALALDKIFQGQAVNALIILYLAVVSGGLHLDALADTIDGFAGGKSPAQRLKIMRQGASGPVGVAAVTIALLLKYTFLNSLGGPVRLLALLTVPAMARWPMVWMAWRLPAVRRSGLGWLFARRTKGIDAAGAGALTVGVSAYLSWLLNPAYLLLLPALFLLAVIGTRVNKVFIGGVTGDTLGAMVEISEIALLIAINVVARYA